MKNPPRTLHRDTTHLHACPRTADARRWPLGPVAADLLEAIRDGYRQVDRLAEHTGREPVKIRHALERLTTAGYVRRTRATKRGGSCPYRYSLTPAGAAKLRARRDAGVENGVPITQQTVGWRLTARLAKHRRAPLAGDETL